MAVFTPLSDDQIRDVLALYDLGAYVRHEGILEGVENSNFHVFTNRAHLVLTIFESRTNVSDLPFFFNYTDHLEKNGISCPSPLHNREGGTAITISGKQAALFPFLEGRSLTVTDLAPDHCRSLGAYVARMHLAVADFAKIRPNPLSIEGWKNLAEKTRNRADTVQPGLARMIDDELLWLSQHWPRDLPQGAIHADVFPDNVFFRQGEVSAVIDFYFSATDMLAYDLAIVINAWCFDQGYQFRPAYYQALINGYESVRPLSTAEKVALPVLLRGASVRFLMTRLHDWIFHDPASFVRPHDPMAYVTRLKFHQTESLAA